MTRIELETQAIEYLDYLETQHTKEIDKKNMIIVFLSVFLVLNLF